MNPFVFLPKMRRLTWRALLLAPLLVFGLQAQALTFVAETNATPAQVRSAIEAATNEAGRFQALAVAQMLAAQLLALDPENRSVEQNKFIYDFVPQFDSETRLRIFQGAFMEAVRAGHENAAASAFQGVQGHDPHRVQEFVCGCLDYIPIWSVAAFTAAFQPNDPTLDQYFSTEMREFFSRFGRVLTRVPALGQFRCQVGVGDRVGQISVAQAVNRFRQEIQKEASTAAESTASGDKLFFGCSREAILKHLRWSWPSFQPGVFAPLGLSEGTCRFVGHVSVKGDLYTLHVNRYIPEAQKMIVVAKDPEGLVNEIDKHLKNTTSPRR
jgi:hypothetical protein